MLLVFRKTFQDAHDEDKSMSVTIVGDTLEFQIETNNEGEIGTFHLRKSDVKDLTSFAKSHLELLGIASAVYRKKGVGVCILDYYGEIDYKQSGEMHHKLPDSNIDNYNYDKLSKTFHQEGVIYALFDMYEGVGDNTMRDIIQYCVVSQAKFVFSGEPSSARKLTLKDVSNAIGVDIASVSRCTRHVRIYSPCGKVFTLDNKSLNLDQPSLFDEGIKWKDGYVSRLEVLHRIKCIREGVGDGKSLSDEEISRRLQQMGYVISRRTVAKYRNILDKKTQGKGSVQMW